MSAPLLENSYLPAMKKNRVLSKLKSRCLPKMKFYKLTKVRQYQSVSQNDGGLFELDQATLKSKSYISLLTELQASSCSPIKVSSDKLLDASLVSGVQVLKLMHGWEFFHIQPIWSHHIYARVKQNRADFTLLVEEKYKQYWDIVFACICSHFTATLETCQRILKINKDNLSKYKM